MSDSPQSSETSLFEPFVGIWITTKSPGDLACAKIVNGRLLIPYNRNGGKAIGHYRDCKVVGQTLYCSFEHFDSASAGFLFLTRGPNETLVGGRWYNHQASASVRNDVSSWSETLPGMVSVVWIRVLVQQTPAWAVKYFDEDWTPR